MIYTISPSNKPDKKWQVVAPNNHTIHFGAKGYEDYTIHKDKERKKRYIARHQNKEDWTNPNTAGFWSRWLIWNKSDLFSSIKDIEKRFNIKIKLYL